jgi:NitT/TauT family transport system permease protein
MTPMWKRRAKSILSAAVIFFVLLLLWLGLIRLFRIQPYMLPTPLDVLRAATARNHSLSTSLWITTTEAAGGLAASVVVGLIVSLIFAQSPWLRKMLYPYTILLQTVPIEPASFRSS